MHTRRKRRLRDHGEIAKPIQRVRVGTRMCTAAVAGLSRGVRVESTTCAAQGPLQTSQNGAPEGCRANQVRRKDLTLWRCNMVCGTRAPVPTHGTCARWPGALCRSGLRTCHKVMGCFVLTG